MLNKVEGIAVVGAGAIGGITAAFIKQAGWDVELACKHQEIVDRALSSGLHVFGVKGERHVQLKAVKDIADLSGPKKVVLLATKANDCVAAARDLIPLLHEDSAVVSLQNGICEDALADVLGRNRVFGCVTAWGATMHGPGELEMTSGGEFVIGGLDIQKDERLYLVQKMLSAVVPTRISENIMGELYSKLVINSCISSLGVITGSRLGSLLSQRKVRNIFIAIMREAMAVAEAMGIKVAAGGEGKLDYYKFLKGRGFLSSLKQHLLIKAIGFKYRRIRSSSLQSLERGRKTEIDYLNGYICDRGRVHGVATPLNKAIVTMVKEIEAGERSVIPENINDPAFEKF